MDDKRLEGEDLRAAIEGILRDYSLEVAYSSAQKPYEFQPVTLDLTTARTDGAPYVVNFPFKSWYVVSATDALASVNLKIHSNDSFAQGLPLYLKDTGNLDRPASKGYITHSAQSGKSITIFFSVSTSFRSGSQVSSTAGGVSITEGSAFTTSQVVLTAATATQLFPTNSLRKLGTWVNESGADVWVGASTVTSTGSTRGIKVPPGGTYYWRNSAPLYAYSVAGSSSEIIMEET